MRKHTIVLLGLLLSASCQKFAEGKQMFYDLLALRGQIATEFHEQDINIEISNGRHIIVTFQNSMLNSAARDVKQKRATDVAAFVTSHYKHPVDSVTTVFASKRGSWTVSDKYPVRLTASTK